MKFLEKLKNTFFEEEFVEVEEDEEEIVRNRVAKKIEPKEIKKEKREIKKEVKKEEKVEPKVVVEEKKIEPAFIEDEEEIDEIKEIKPVKNYSDNSLMKNNSKLPDFDDDDFVSSDLKIAEEPKKLYGEDPNKLYNSMNYSNNYSSKPYGAVQKDAFKPTPIISPIYGILDKNYRKEEVVDKKDKPSSYVSRKNADLDSIRRKAYGLKEEVTIEEKKEEVPFDSYNSIDTDFGNDIDDNSDNLLFDMTSTNSKPVVDQVTLADAEEYFNDLGLEYNVDYKDSKYEKATGRRSRVDSAKIEVDDTKDEEFDIPKNFSDDDNLEDNLFDLIDTMYEDGE